MSLSSRGTVCATAFAACVAKIALAIPAVLNGLFQRDLATTSAQLTWISDAFLVPVALFELASGVLGDLFGRKRLLIAGSLLLTLGELVCVCTPGASAGTDVRVAVLWTGQAIAGVGAAVLFPTSLAMVAAATHSTRARAHGIAVWSAALATGGFVSPLLGGLVARFNWAGIPATAWKWAFLAVVVLALTCAAVALTAQNSSAPAGRSLDWPGQITLTIALLALLLAIIQGSTSGWRNSWVVTGFLVFAVFAPLFVLVEHRAPAPLPRLALYRNRAFAVNAAVTLIGMFSFLGTVSATSIRLSAIQKFSPLKTAVAFVLLLGFTLALLPLTERAIAHYQPKWALGGGFLLMGAGDLWISTQSAASLSIWPIVAPLAPVGIGFAFALSGVTAVAVNSVPGHLAGMASGSTNQLRDFGFTLGPAVVSAIALGGAAAQIQDRLAGDPTLRSALDAFERTPSQLPTGARATAEAAVRTVRSGPLGANAIPANPLKDVAFHALDHAYSIA
ncbi:MFS transporter [Amycolatopsis pigmentata]|uniref:MFS transporter n=1 Tax=Amycolatopsis pigmentata TaxID=450801 RepID=A0ABW5FL17_9PSEU